MSEGKKKVIVKKVIKKVVTKSVTQPQWASAPLRTFEDVPSLTKQYWKGTPYPHIALENVVTDKKFLIAVRSELAKLELVEKSTDLYSVQQSPDLANIDPNSDVAKKHLKHTMMLREAIYSESFRNLVSEIAGCGPLSAKPDMAASAYTHTSHLLVHDDVINTRKIAYIIYLTPEESKWEAKDGGALELYPKSAEDPSVPDCCPTTRIMPLFNQMAFFTVVPGESFHAVQEVYSPDKARLSVQGWYHTDAPRDAIETQMSLKAMKKEVQKFSSEPMTKIAIAGHSLPSVSSSEAMVNPFTVPEADMRYLAELGVNPIYFKPSILAQLADDFVENKAISLQDIFVDEIHEGLKELVKMLDHSQETGAFGEGPPEDRVGADKYWALTGPPHIQRFLKLTMESEDDTNKAGAKRAREDEELADGEQENPSAVMAVNLKNLIRQVFRSDAFARLVNIIVAPATGGLGFNARSCVGRRFRPSLDYTVATIPNDTPRLYSVFTTCFTEHDVTDPADREDDDDDDEESVWQSCSCGGFDGILTAEEDANPEVLQLHKHNEEEDGVVNLPCMGNSLSIFLVNPNQIHFTKYVDSSAPSSRVDVTTVFTFDGELPAEEAINLDDL